MGLYLYCAVPAGHRPPAELRGIGDQTVEALPHGSLLYWYSELAARPEPSIEGIRHHNVVVEAAVTDLVTPVPLRFGQWLASAEDAAPRLAERAQAHAAALARFAGALEFGIRVLDPALEAARDVRPPRVGSGRDYLMALREHHHPRSLPPLAEELRSRMHESLGPLIADERVEPGDSTHAVLSAAHLVPRRHFDEYRARTQALRSTYRMLRFLLSGPWLPYSFAA